MKKIIALLLALCLVASLAACSGSGDKNGTQGGSNETNPDGSTPSVPEDTFVFSYNGTEIKLHAPAEPIVAALGEPMSYTEQTSCAFEGLDKTYYYGSFYMDTYPTDGKDFVYSVWFADDTVKTEEGICIGSSKAQVEAAYGADAFNGSNAYIVRKGDCELTVILENDVVTSVQYSVVIA